MAYLYCEICGDKTVEYYAGKDVGDLLILKGTIRGTDERDFRCDTCNKPLEMDDISVYLTGYEDDKHGYKILQNITKLRDDFE